MSEHETEAAPAPVEPGVDEFVTPEHEGDLLDDQADAAEDFLNGLLDALDMDGEATAEIEDETILVAMEGPDMAVLIGRHGLTLEALQELTRATVQHQTSSRVRLVLDIAGYRDRQRIRIERLARDAAATARRDRTPIELEPMNSFERKIVHNALVGFDGVTTSSEGEDPDRRVVVRPS